MHEKWKSMNFNELPLLKDPFNVVMYFDLLSLTPFRFVNFLSNVFFLGLTKSQSLGVQLYEIKNRNWKLMSDEMLPVKSESSVVWLG